jgi:hypothetical protein
MSAPRIHRLWPFASHQSGHPGRRCDRPLCIVLNGLVWGEPRRSRVVRPPTPPGEGEVAEPATLTA